jgi:RNA-directed DNA polymerase
MVAELNPVLRGWAGYFCMGPVSDTYRTINSHLRYRFREWWLAKHKGVRLDPRWHWSRWLEQRFGLLELKWDPSRLPNAKA